MPYEKPLKSAPRRLKGDGLRYNPLTINNLLVTANYEDIHVP